MLFTVSGKYPFPTDMLRYDRCFPATSEDAENLVAALDRQQFPKRFSITLRSDTTGNVSEERWKSFLWRVIYIYIDHL